MAQTDLGEVRQLVDLLLKVRAEKRALTEIEEQARAGIQAILGDNETGVLDGEEVVTWKEIKRTALSQRILKRDFPEAFAACQDVSVSRVFRIAD